MCYSAIYVFLFAIYVNVGHIWMTNNIYVSHKLAIYESWEQTYMRQSCIYVEFSPYMAHVHTYMKEKRRIWIKDLFYICEMCDIYGKRSCHICKHAYCCFIYVKHVWHICLVFHGLSNHLCSFSFYILWWRATLVLVWISRTNFKMRCIFFLDVCAL